MNSTNFKTKIEKTRLCHTEEIRRETKMKRCVYLEITGNDETDDEMVGSKNVTRDSMCLSRDISCPQAYTHTYIHTYIRTDAIVIR